MSDTFSPYILAVTIAWVASHFVKNCICIFKKQKINFFKNFFESGGMPSSHTATVTALAVVVGLRDGLNGGLFGISSLFAIIVAYDAFKVRRSSGEQGYALKKLLAENNSKVDIPYISRGHTPLEVFFGAVFGVLIGAVVFLSTK